MIYLLSKIDNLGVVVKTENNNLFADFDALNQTGAANTGNFLNSDSLLNLPDVNMPGVGGLISEPTDDLFDKMWESCDSWDNDVNKATSGRLTGRKEFKPLSPDAFMAPTTVLKGRGSAPAFDDVLPERLRPVQLPSEQVENTVPDEIRYFEQLWETGEFPNRVTYRPKTVTKTQNVFASEEFDVRRETLYDLPLSDLKPQSTFDSVEVPQLLDDKPIVQKQESIVKTEDKKTEEKKVVEKKSEDKKTADKKTVEKKPEEKKPEPPRKAELTQPNRVQTQRTAIAVRKDDASQSKGGWTLSVISCLIALFIGLFAFGWKALPAYLVQYQIQQATGMSLRMKNVSQDYRAGMTSVESVRAFDSAQRPFFETGHAVFSSLPYFVGDNQYMKWAMVEGIRFAPTQTHVSSMNASLSNNDFNKALKCVAKEMDDSQLDLLVKNSVSTISSPYEQTIRHAEQEVKDITMKIQVLQERLLSTGDEATDAEKAQAASYQQRMQMALKNMSIEETQYNQRNSALLGNLRSKREGSNAEANIPAIKHGDVTEYLFGQEYMDFTGLFLFEIRQFCRWLPADLEKALGPADKLDPASLSFRRIATQEQLAVGQIRLTGQTQFMNQTVPFSAVISNYSTKPNSKPLTLDVAFGEDQSARLRLEAHRSGKRTEIKVEFASSNVNPGMQFGLEDGLRVKLSPDEKTPFIQTRSIQFVVADGKIQGEYAMAQTAPSISVGVSGVRSENNVARLNQLVQNVEKITLNGTISGRFAKPEIRVTSNLESWGRTVLSIAANEYDMRMDTYRAVIEQKSSEAIESDQKRLAKMAQVVKVSANGNALLLNQLSSGAVDSQIAVEPSPSNVAKEEVAKEDEKADAPTLEVKEENTDAEKVANSDDDLTLPSLDELTMQETTVQEESPEVPSFPELPVPEPETALPSAQIAAGDVALDELPPLEDNATETNSTPVETNNSTPAETTVQQEQTQENEFVEEYPELPVLPSVEELLPVAEPTAETETSDDSLTLAPPALPSLEDLAPQNDVQKAAPMELQTSPKAAKEINSPDANYQSPEMEFIDDAPMEEALPEVEVERTENGIPLVAPNTNSTAQRQIPPSLPIVIEE